MIEIMQYQQAQLLAIHRLYLNAWRKAFKLEPMRKIEKEADTLFTDEE